MHQFEVCKEFTYVSVIADIFISILDIGYVKQFQISANNCRYTVSAIADICKCRLSVIQTDCRGYLLLRCRNREHE